MQPSNQKTDKPLKQITSLKSSQQLRQYLQSHRNLNLSLMKDKNNATLLHYASFNNDIIKLKIYFQHYKAYCQVTHGKKMYQTGFETKVKAWINQANNQGLTALHFAALHGNVEIIKMLQELGGNMEFKTNQNQNLFFMAVQNNHLKTLIYLIQQSNNRLDLEDRNNIGDTILHKAARNGMNGICSYLLTKKIDPNLQNSQGWTPLMQAVNGNHKQITKSMLLKGVDRNIINNEAKKAIDMAREDNKKDFINILNDQFSFGQKLKIACNTKIVYRQQKSSYIYCIAFILIYNIVFLPTCVLTQFRNIPKEFVIFPIIGQGIYYAFTIILFCLLLLKPQQKSPKKSLLNIQMPFCSECRNKKNNQFHCYICKTCIYRYDHHCPWINNCVGGKNIGKFYAFLWLVQIGSLFVIFCHLCMLGLGNDLIKYRAYTAIEQGQKQVSIICLITSLFFSVSIFLLILRQSKNIFTNTTQYERAKKTKTQKNKSFAGKSSTILTQQNNQSQGLLSQVQDEDIEGKGCLSNCSAMLCQKVI